MPISVTLPFRQLAPKLKDGRPSADGQSREAVCFQCGNKSLVARACGETTQLSCQICGLKKPEVTLQALGTSLAEAPKSSRKSSPPSAPSSLPVMPTAEEAEEAFTSPLPFGEYTLPAFPASIFPPWLRLFVEAVAENTQTPVDLSGTLALSALALCGAGVAEVNAGADWWEPLNLFTVIVAAPGSRKSAVFKSFMGPVITYEKQTNRQRKTSSETTGAAYTPLQLFADDITTEKLAVKLEEQGGRMAVLSAEGGLFGIAAGLYNEGGKPANIDVLLKGHAGDVLRVDRLKRDSLYLPSPALTLGICTQPEVLEGLASIPGFRGKGLLARFLFSLPADNVGHRKIETERVSEVIRDDYRQGIEHLLLLEPQENEEGEKRAHSLYLSPEAHTRFLQVRERIEFSLRDGEEYGEFKDWGGKLAGAIARIAGLLHLANHGLSVREISCETMTNAESAGQYFASHAKAAFGQMGMDVEMNRARKILAWVKRSGETEFTRRAVHNALQGTFPRAEMLMKPLEILCDRGYLRETEPVSPGGVGRKPSLLYQANPSLFTSS